MMNAENRTSAVKGGHGPGVAVAGKAGVSRLKKKAEEEVVAAPAGELDESALQVAEDSAAGTPPESALSGGQQAAEQVEGVVADAAGAVSGEAVEGRMAEAFSPELDALVASRPVSAAGYEGTTADVPAESAHGAGVTGGAATGGGATGATGMNLFGLLGLLGGGVGLSALGGGGGSGGVAAVANLPSITVAVAAGKFMGGVVAYAYDSAGNLLGSAEVASGNTFTITLARPYTGSVLVVVQDGNGTAANYVNEATQAGTDLNGAELRAMAVVGGSDTLTVAVTPLTELAVREAGVSSTTPPAESVVTAMNAGLSAKLGFDILTTTPVTVDDTAAWNASTSAAAKSYGHFLAAMAGADTLQANGMAGTLDVLSSAISVSADGTVTWAAGAAGDAAQELLLAGAQAYSESPAAVDAAPQAALTSALGFMGVSSVGSFLAGVARSALTTGVDATGLTNGRSASAEVPSGHVAFDVLFSGTVQHAALTANYAATLTENGASQTLGITSVTAQGGGHYLVVVDLGSATSGEVTLALSPTSTIVDGDGNALVSPAATVVDASGQALRQAVNVPQAAFTLDAAAPVASVVAGDILTTGSATVQSTEAGTAYLVSAGVAVTDLTSITSAADDLWNSVAVAAGTDVALSAAGLRSGDYRVYAVDALGNLSQASANSVSVTVPVAAVELSAVVAGTGGFALHATAMTDNFGNSVSNAGDVNGDGLDDVIIGDAFANVSAGDDGMSFVVFGKTDGTMVDPSAVANGTGGFVIKGAHPGDQSGWSVSGAGDVNGDGLADLVVGAPFFDTFNTGYGRSYVVFGKADGAAVDLSAVEAGTGGYAINGGNTGGLSGWAVSGAGDVNGDGLADVIVGAKNVSGPTGFQNGTSYVVFGKTDGTAIDLTAVAAGTGGFVINGQSANDHAGYSVSSAGDVNGDGLADLIVGARDAAVNGEFVGKSYVVFGKANGTAVDLTAVASGTGGFVINGELGGDNSGVSVSAAGDVNGDGLADVVVGASGANAGAGKSYVVFGKADGTAVDLSAAASGAGGFAINGEQAGNHSGASVSVAGDVNGDGLSDLIIGAPSINMAYVVFGKTGSTAIDLSAVAAGDGGFAVRGMGDLTGTSVSAAGDVNGDGLADLVVGAPFHLNSYVIFGSAGDGHAANAVDWLGTTGNDSYAATASGQTLVGNAGDDTLTASGATVMMGGSGDDTFIVDAGMAAALQAGMGAVGNTDVLARVDGGTGIDAIRLAGAGIMLDLTQVASVAAGNPDGGGRISGIEKLDLTGTGNNTLKLASKDVMDMAGFDTYQTTGRHQVLVVGDAGDTLDLADGTGTTGWTHAAGVSINGTTYATWIHDTSLNTVYVSSAMGVI